MTKKGHGAPVGNRNAAGPHLGTGTAFPKHTGISGVLGRAVGMKQWSPADKPVIASILERNKTLIVPKKMSKTDSAFITKAMKRTTPW